MIDVDENNVLKTGYCNFSSPVSFENFELDLDEDIDSVKVRISGTCLVRGRVFCAEERGQSSSAPYGDSSYEYDDGTKYEFDEEDYKIDEVDEIDIESVELYDEDTKSYKKVTDVFTAEYLVDRILDSYLMTTDFDNPIKMKEFKKFLKDNNCVEIDSYDVDFDTLDD